MDPLAIGDLRHLIQIQQPIDAQNEFGEIEQSWLTYANAYAAIVPTTGKDVALAQARSVSPVGTMKMVTRFVAGVQPFMRVLYGNRVFSIVSVNDVEERHYRLDWLLTEDLKSKTSSLPVYLYSTPGDPWLSGFESTGLPDLSSLGYRRFGSITATESEANLKASTSADWTSWANQITYGGATAGDFQAEVIPGLDGALTTLDATDLTKLLGAVSTCKSVNPGFKLALFGLPWASNNQSASVQNCSDQMKTAGIWSSVDYGTINIELATYSGWNTSNAASQLQAVYTASVAQINSQKNATVPIRWNLYPQYIDLPYDYFPIDFWTALVQAVAQTASATRGDIVTILIGFDATVGNQLYVPSTHGKYLNAIASSVGGLGRVP